MWKLECRGEGYERQGDGGERQRDRREVQESCVGRGNEIEGWNERGSGKEGGRRSQIVAQRLKGHQA